MGSEVGTMGKGGSAKDAIMALYGMPGGGGGGGMYGMGGVPQSTAGGMYYQPGAMMGTPTMMAPMQVQFRSIEAFVHDIAFRLKIYTETKTAYHMAYVP